MTYLLIYLFVAIVTYPLFYCILELNDILDWSEKDEITEDDMKLNYTASALLNSALWPVICLKKMFDICNSSHERD